MREEEEIWLSLSLLFHQTAHTNNLLFLTNISSCRQLFIVPLSILSLYLLPVEGGKGECICMRVYLAMWLHLATFASYNVHGSWHWTRTHLLLLCSRQPKFSYNERLYVNGQAQGQSFASLRLIKSLAKVAACPFIRLQITWRNLWALTLSDSLSNGCRCCSSLVCLKITHNLL